MIVMDPSAIIAIMFEEAEAPACMIALQKDGSRLVSAVNRVEAGAVMAGRSRSGDRREAIADLEALPAAFEIDIAPVDDRLARAAMKATIDFGQGFATRGGIRRPCSMLAMASFTPIFNRLWPLERPTEEPEAPWFLIFDEPTSAFDLKIPARFRDLRGSAKADSGDAVHSARSALRAGRSFWQLWNHSPRLQG